MHITYVDAGYDGRKLVLLHQLIDVQGSWSHILYLPWRQDKHQYRATSSVWNILAIS